MLAVLLTACGTTHTTAPRARHTVSARIEANGQFMFNNAAHPVLTQGGLPARAAP